MCASGVFGSGDASAVRTRAVSRPSFPSRTRNCYGPTQLVYTQLQRAKAIQALTRGTHTHMTLNEALTRGTNTTLMGKNVSVIG